MSGYGHVASRPDGAVARCGGPAMCHDCARELMESGKPVRTGLRCALNCEDWDVAADTRVDDTGLRTGTRTVLIGSARVPAARLRRIGWLDQLGRVWLRSSDWDGKGGSLTPLLIDPGERRG